MLNPKEERLRLGGQSGMFQVTQLRPLALPSHPLGIFLMNINSRSLEPWLWIVLL